MRGLTLQLDPFQTQFLRYLFGLLVMLPLVARSGLAAYRPRNIGGQFVRGAVHTFGLCLWFTAIPHITLADTTAIGFTGPIFIMIGAAWLLRRAHALGALGGGADRLCRRADRGRAQADRHAAAATP